MLQLLVESRNDSFISDTTYTKSRHNVLNKERFKFCESREITSPTYISMKFDCGFEAEEVEKFSTSLLPMVETIFTGLVNDNRATWILSHNWCFYFVQGNKGFDKSKSTNQCIYFYVSESTLRPIMDVGSNNATVETERQTIQNNFGRMLATSVHEGWHVHSFSNHDRSKINLFINELQAYTVAAYVELYANLHLNTRILNRKSLIPIEDQVYLLESCDSETDLIDLLNLNKGHESYTAFAVFFNRVVQKVCSKQPLYCA
ncbi:hypothetical protein [Aliidiomarina taiwanensis]|nr:hypothetical protein [Aliidiomarina taiwanensis]